MTEYVKSKQTFAEQASAPATPDTGFAVVYPKTDGLMYFKDDAGVETLLSGGTGSSGGGVNEVQYPTCMLEATFKGPVSVTGSDITTEYVTMANASTVTATTPHWRVTQALADEIAAGNSLFVEFGGTTTGTGNIDTQFELSSWDTSAGSFPAKETLTQIVNVPTTAKENVWQVECALTPAVGDWIAFKFTRNGSSESDTLNATFYLSWIRIYTDTPAGS